MADELHIDTK